jgi:pyruvate formate lyase activating enzyme
MGLKAKENGLHTVMVSNGYVNSYPLSEIAGFIDAFNIDLKAFNDDFYKKLTGARLQPVLESLKQIAKAGKHLEVTTLIIPGRNDSDNEMEAESRFISEELGGNTPFHLSRYFPTYKRDDPATPVATLDRLYEIASKYLKNVYVGNTGTGNGQDTKCTVCGTLVTGRSGYRIRLLNLDNEGKCTKCGNLVYRYFNFPSPTGD